MQIIAFDINNISTVYYRHTAQEFSNFKTSLNRAVHCVLNT